MVPRILIFSIAKGAKPLFQVKFISTYKVDINNFFLSGVARVARVARKEEINFDVPKRDKSRRDGW